jgi:hypothetical protein
MLDAGSWRLRLGAGGWGLEAGGCRLDDFGCPGGGGSKVGARGYKWSWFGVDFWTEKGPGAARTKKVKVLIQLLIRTYEEKIDVRFHGFWESGRGWVQGRCLGVEMVMVWCLFLDRKRPRGSQDQKSEGFNTIVNKNL